jgi:hypothetical protein
MKKLFTFFSLFILLFTGRAAAQEIVLIVHDSIKYGILANDIILDFEVINVSPDTQIVFEVRTINDLPEGWQSSLCFGLNCFAPHLDSIATLPEFTSEPVPPGDTLITSLHVYPDSFNHGTAYVQIEFGTFSNPTNRITQNFIASTVPVSVDDENISPLKFRLQQNFPNPFNPSSIIRYMIEKESEVTLKIYDMLGKEVALLVREVKPPGVYEIEFDAGTVNGLTSGIYFYTLTAGDFRETKKMVLIR